MPFEIHVPCIRKQPRGTICERGPVDAGHLEAEVLASLRKTCEIGTRFLNLILSEDPLEWASRIQALEGIPEHSELAEDRAKLRTARPGRHCDYQARSVDRIKLSSKEVVGLH